jgi:hypothetical protein
MVANGLRLPAAFVKFCEAIREGKLPDAWQPKEDSLWVGLDCLEIIPSLEWIQSETDFLTRAFQEENRF